MALQFPIGCMTLACLGDMTATCLSMYGLLLLTQTADFDVDIIMTARLHVHIAHSVTFWDSYRNSSLTWERRQFWSVGFSMAGEQKGTPPQTPWS